ncbi:TraR/DksA family transcriptional regulator [Candidatus Sororendozoicomonas aggregata]|uniref:TraR/DksA family transcriptional regulator n=1 Tax=Candidatus Sororendozoicomonas aggregata TaxID=3073239 RepID=UPI002ED03D52
MVDYEQMKAQLIARREELNDRVRRIKAKRQQAPSADWSEQAQERENDEVMDALGNETTLELNKINKALERIDECEYGYCLVCGDAISPARLEIMPFADLCIRCAQARE